MNDEARDNSPSWDTSRRRKKRVSPKEREIGRTFGKLCRYYLLTAGRIRVNDVKAIYEMTDEEFDRWIITGER